MKKYIFLLVWNMVIYSIIGCIGLQDVKADNRSEKVEEPSNLYGLSALLMDAESGEVLYEKNGNAPMAVASTTKILTCILAIEECQLDEIVTISEYAASQPDVQMNAEAEEQYVLSDLLKGMMLESFNDISVAVAEHVCGSVDAFSNMMNKKAEELGCNDSFFITPNGLDEEKNEIENRSTAEDMAKIMCYAIKNKEFIEITQTQECLIQECHGKRTVSAQNKNRFMLEYEGMISGKTGFTNKAGYCYVGAAKRDNRTFVAVTLGCGWPPNKNYKWTDIRTLLDYGFKNFQYKNIDYLGVIIPDTIDVENGHSKNDQQTDTVKLQIPKVEKILVGKEDTFYGKVYLKEKLHAPVKQGEKIGRIDLYKNDILIDQKYIKAADDVVESNIWYKMWKKCILFLTKISKKYCN